ncbi:unnamed protein product [Polarella glacialis]|uniref:Uncharacterized protein n=1 Tax=Polarella glacialis TaxID=89957 RepID=A0A813KSM1_POLGL|nr:unnamed protein product [Polarella glacialis]
MRMQVRLSHFFCNRACSRINNSSLLINRFQLLGWFSPSASLMMHNMVVPGSLRSARQDQAEARLRGVTSTRPRQNPEGMNSCIAAGCEQWLEEAACDAPFIRLQVC